MRPVLLHYHILKNGGSTIEEILRRSFGAGFAALDRADRDAEIKPGELIGFLKEHPQVRAFSSHQIFYPVPRVAGFLFFDICFLRDPFDRIRSIYDYFRGKPADDDPIRLLAHRLSLRDFVAQLIEEMPWTVTDTQVNLLAHGIVNDVPRGAGDLELASRRMAETSFLGVVECFEESLVAGEYAMRTVFPQLDCAQQRVNESARAGSTVEQRLEQFRQDCGEDIFAELSRRNGMDRQLLRRARAEVQRRFEKTPRAEERLRELRGGVTRRVAKTALVRKKAVKRAPGVVTRAWRGLRFLADVRMSRPGSAFRRLFDAGCYGGSLWDFVTRGAESGGDPHPLFDSEYYRQHSGCGARANALAWYLRRGGRPHPLFDPEYYRRRYPDVARAGLDPLLHYVRHGAAEGRKPNPWFEPEFYFGGCPAARETANPLVHFLQTSAANPHALFDCESYLRAHPKVEENPLADFLRRGEIAKGGTGIVIDEVELPEKCDGAAHLRRFWDCVRGDQLDAQG